MSVTRKALWVIERNFASNLDLDEIARACGVSKYHLAHAFGQTTGMSAIQYLRGRRLSEAAKALASGAPDILAVALESGYGSHEAFTRAFRGQFGLTPEDVRARKSVAGLALLYPRELADAQEAKPAPEPRFAEGETIRAVGLPERHSFKDKTAIPGQWQRFMARFSEIENVLPGIPIGISANVDEEGDFDYLCAAEVSAFGRKPREFVQLTIPVRRYAVLEHSGHISDLARTYEALWDLWLPSLGLVVADAPSLERHKATFDPRTGSGGVDLWIPIETPDVGSGAGRFCRGL